MSRLVELVADDLEDVFSDFEAVGEPDGAAFYWIAVVHDFCVYQYVSEPFAEVFAPVFSWNKLFVWVV